ncbi:MAG: lamin tail domain-containing protein, partial [Verrucomicrobiota bacterium]
MPRFVRTLIVALVLLSGTLAFCELVEDAPSDSVVVFNEMMYHPLEDSGGIEWLEIFNQMAVDIDLSAWSLAGGVEFSFPEGTVLGGGGYLAVVGGVADSIPPNVFGPFSGTLSNEGDSVYLVNNSGRVMDSLHYRDSLPWPEGADGSGHTLAKRDPRTPSGEAALWTTSRTPGGSPGRPNEVHVEGTHLLINETSGASESPFFVELFNPTEAAAGGDGWTIRSSRDGHPVYRFGQDQILGPASHLVLREDEIGFRPLPGDLLFLQQTSTGELADAARVDFRGRGRFPDGEARGRYTLLSTPGGSNEVELNEAIVINEIMYHAVPRYSVEPERKARVVLPFDHVWRYRAEEEGLPPGWASESHPDWLSGPGILGNESNLADMPEPIGTSIDSHLTTFYFETDFHCPAEWKSFVWTALPIIDDGAVVFLNGKEIHRFNLPSGVVDSDLAASSEVENASYGSPLSLPQECLQAGSNRLSIEVHQERRGSDMLMGVELVCHEEIASGVPFEKSDEEWLELYNRGKEIVDLAGWQLSEGIQYRFPFGTRLNPGEYLVVAKNPGSFSLKYPGLVPLGPYAGRLGNGGDRVVLTDASGNPADEVAYTDGGVWPWQADGYGSSLELLNPLADNSQAVNWAPSREEGGWVSVRYRGAGNPRPNAGLSAQQPDWFHELVFGLLGKGAVYLDDVSVIEDPEGVANELVSNGDFSAPERRGDVRLRVDDWRLLGNHGIHGESVLVPDPEDDGNQVLKVVATGGHSQSMGNQIETTLGPAGFELSSKKVYEISFRARWIEGTPRLHSRLFFNRLPKVSILPVDFRGGTPGSENSSFQSDRPTVFDSISHHPLIPEAGEEVIVRVGVSDPDGIRSVNLHFSEGEGFSRRRMSEAGAGSFSVEIDGADEGSVIQFYISVEDENGVEKLFPAEGQGSRA